MHRRTLAPPADAGNSDDTAQRDTVPNSTEQATTTATDTIQDPRPAHPETSPKPVEVGGPKGLEPTRYGDWERNGRCSDF